MKQNFKRKYIIPSLVAAFLIGMIVFGMDSKAPEKTAKQETGFIESIDAAPAPAISFLDEKGAERSLTEFKGNVVILNFWALWCFPCKQEMPALAKLQKELGPKGFKVLPLSSDYSPSTEARKFYSENNIEGLDVYIDVQSKAFKAFDLKGLPTSIILDKDGNVVGKATGYIDWDSKESREFVNSLL